MFRFSWRPLRAVPVLVALALTATAIAPLSLATAKSKTKHHHSAKRKHKRRAHRKAKPVKAATEPCTPTPPQSGAVDAATQAFIAHLYSAHLSTSPAQQVDSILSNPDNYVLVHTALVEAMLKTGVSDFSDLGSVGQAVITPFFAHIYNAHLSQSPAQQVNAILSSPDQYAMLHTVWAQTMLTPLADWFETLMGGTPGTDCSGGGSAGGGSSSPPPSPPPASSQDVMIMNYSFMPGSVTVGKGTKVTWTNDDNVPHTVTSSSGNTLNSPNIAPKGTWSYTFSTLGTYKYYCAVHPNMTGTITVQ
jgi:plastocyanin